MVSCHCVCAEGRDTELVANRGASLPSPVMSELIIVAVPLRERSYPVLVGDGARDSLPLVIPPGACRAAVVTQQGIDVEVDPGIPNQTFVIPEGESAKELATVQDLCRDFAAFGLTRRDVVVAVGGGVVTDVAGFAAAVYHRGTAVVHVPTTLLGQIDAAIGGKTGVNLPEGKNLVGAYWQPSGVLCDTQVLDTLPQRELLAGYGELAKYHFIGCTDQAAGLIGPQSAAPQRTGPQRTGPQRTGPQRTGPQSAGTQSAGSPSERSQCVAQRGLTDATEASPLQPSFPPSSLTGLAQCDLGGEALSKRLATGAELTSLNRAELVAACVAIKAEVVSSDETESGRRALLNYGHTLGHALEIAGRFDLRHGEAVAIGLRYAAVVARLLGRIDDERVAEHESVLRQYGLVSKLPPGIDHDEIIGLFARDKKSVDGITFVLDGPRGLEVIPRIDPSVLRKALTLM